MELDTLAIVQSRMGSTRFPGKALKEVNGYSLIEILLLRLCKSKKIDKIVLATSNKTENDILEKKVIDLGFDVFRGSENDVLNRYDLTAKKYSPNTVVRITGDCPLIDPELVDEIINFYQKKNVDYASNVDPPTYPDGLDVEVFSSDALHSANINAIESFDREHVTPHIRRSSKIKRANFHNPKDFSSERWTVDNIEDYEVVKNIFNHFKPNIYFSWYEVIQLKKVSPDFFLANQNIKRNEGS